MKIFLATVVILLSLIGCILGFQMWRFCKTRPAEEVLEHAFWSSYCINNLLFCGRNEYKKQLKEMRYF